MDAGVCFFEAFYLGRKNTLEFFIDLLRVFERIAVNQKSGRFDSLLACGRIVIGEEVKDTGDSLWRFRFVIGRDP